MSFVSLRLSQSLVVSAFCETSAEHRSRPSTCRDIHALATLQSQDAEDRDRVFVACLQRGELAAHAPEHALGASPGRGAGDAGGQQLRVLGLRQVDAQLGQRRIHLKRAVHLPDMLNADVSVSLIAV